MACEISVGVIGYHIARVLAKTLIDIPRLYPELNCSVRLKTLCGRNLGLLKTVARAYGFHDYTVHWQELAEDPEIDLLINGAPNFLHTEPCIAALDADKHVFCEKPLAGTLAEARRMSQAAGRSNRTTMVGYNYRFVPAIILARTIVKSGQIGSIHQGCFRYIDEAFIDPGADLGWRRDKALSGRGVLGDLGSHAIELARYLLGEPAAVSGSTRIFTDTGENRQITAPDAALGTLYYADGSFFSFEASSCCTGRKNWLAFELYGLEGALMWSLERINELHLYLNRDRINRVSGFRRIYVSSRDHSDLVNWPPVEHPVGIDISYLLELRHLVERIAKDQSVKPEGADFGDGLRIELICEAFEASARRAGTEVDIEI
ncbi:MAG: Gfo/Idh/MocA family oxidoreductase [Spirochaetaceae bacterium]|nr:MAG: Gfo/Idh/MocA family oxidoreductase [Spirochaetaceae bacterium]